MNLPPMLTNVISFSTTVSAFQKVGLQQEAVPEPIRTNVTSFSELISTYENGGWQQITVPSQYLST